MNAIKNTERHSTVDLVLSQTDFLSAGRVFLNNNFGTHRPKIHKTLRVHVINPVVPVHLFENKSCFSAWFYFLCLCSVNSAARFELSTKESHRNFIDHTDIKDLPQAKTPKHLNFLFCIVMHLLLCSKLFQLQKNITHDNTNFYERRTNPTWRGVTLLPDVKDLFKRSKIVTTGWRKDKAQSKTVSGRDKNRVKFKSSDPPTSKFHRPKQHPVCQRENHSTRREAKLTRDSICLERKLGRFESVASDFLATRHRKKSTLCRCSIELTQGRSKARTLSGNNMIAGEKSMPNWYL